MLITTIFFALAGPGSGPSLGQGCSPPLSLVHNAVGAVSGQWVQSLAGWYLGIIISGIWNNILFGFHVFSRFLYIFF